MAFLLEPEAYELLKENGLPIMRYGFAASLTEAEREAERIGYPVVMKIVSPDILHKSDAGGVKVGIQDAEELKMAYQYIMENVKRAVPDGRHQGVLIAPMISGGVETIIGIGSDPEFGRFIMFGLGGVFVELYKDVSFRMIPLDEEEAGDLIRDVKASALLHGYRGGKSADVQALTELISSCSRLAENHPEITELDLNPVIVREDGAYILDARVCLEK